MAFRFLWCVGKVCLKSGGKLLVKLADPLGVAELIYEAGFDLYNEYREQRQEAALRGDIEEVAQADPVVLEKQIAQIVAATPLDADKKIELAAYLSQVAPMIRQSLRRHDDIQGHTMPAALAPRRGEDLQQFLPTKLPLFKAGQRPIAGVDLVLVDLLGRGGFGEVWKARNPYMPDEPAVVLKFTLDESAAKFLRNEVGLLNLVRKHGQHPGIVRLRNTYLSAQFPCLEYEYVEGGDLASLIRSLHAKGRPSLDAVNAWFLHLVEIIAHMHQAAQPIVHCDLKPANILLEKKANGKAALRVTDFGIGGLAATQAILETQRPATSQSVLLTEAARGTYTPLYASPEQKLRRRGEPADPRDDVHALGVIWYQMLTGDLAMLQLPSDWETEVRETGLSAAGIEVLRSCLEPREVKRPRSAAELAKSLCALKRKPKPKVENDEAKKLPNSMLARAVALVSVIAVVVIVVLVLLNKPTIDLEDVKEDAKSIRVEADKSLRMEDGKQVSLADLRAMEGSLKPGQAVTNRLGMKFAWMPPGSFLMGSPPGEAGARLDETQHKVTLTRGYFMATTTVTQVQWVAVMATNPSDSKGDDLPVESVRWNECVNEYLPALRNKDGSGVKYRLPTEAEWEYACRAGTTTAYSIGSDVTNLGDYAWYSANSSMTPHSVAQKRPNAWGLYDMHGNIYQWCQDRYDDKFYTSLVNTDPLCTYSDKKNIVIRGGSWSDSPDDCRASYRSAVAPSYRFSSIGLRVCFDLK